MTGLPDLTRRSPSALRRRRETLIRQLPPFNAILRGSLIERYKPCGKPGCRCATGPGHGPKYYLSVSLPGARPQMVYVPATHHDQAVQSLENYRRLRLILEEICAINLELLRRRKELA